MRAGDWAERENQGDERRARGDGVCEKSDRNVAARESLAHDARADDGGDQEPGAQELTNDSARQGVHHWCPMRSITFFMARESRLASGRLRNRVILRPSVRKASLNARSISSGEPVTAAGSGIPQWAVMGWPGQIGQTSFAALSQTVNTKFISGAPRPENSSQLLLREFSVGRFAAISCLRA